MISLPKNSEQNYRTINRIYFTFLHFSFSYFFLSFTLWNETLTESATDLNEDSVQFSEIYSQYFSRYCNICFFVLLFWQIFCIPKIAPTYRMAMWYYNVCISSPPLLTLLSKNPFYILPIEYVHKKETVYIEILQLQF